MSGPLMGLLKRLGLSSKQSIVVVLVLLVIIFVIKTLRG